MMCLRKMLSLNSRSLRRLLRLRKLMSLSRRSLRRRRNWRRGSKTSPTTISMIPPSRVVPSSSPSLWRSRIHHHHRGGLELHHLNKRSTITTHRSTTHLLDPLKIRVRFLRDQGIRVLLRHRPLGKKSLKSIGTTHLPRAQIWKKTSGISRSPIAGPWHATTFSSNPVDAFHVSLLRTCGCNQITAQNHLNHRSEVAPCKADAP
jgi:hypothetical protein